MDCYNSYTGCSKDAYVCAVDYNNCYAGCEGVNFANRQVLSPVNLATYTECANTYSSCVNANPYGWEQCYDTYNVCVANGTPYVAAKPISAAYNFNECMNCGTRYSDCVTAYPSQW